MRLFAFMAFEVASLVCGELLMKYGMMYMGGFAVEEVVRRPASLIRLALNPFVVAGFALYGLASILWFDILSRAELSYVYPMLSISYVLVVLASRVVFGEQLSLTRLSGVGLICVGVYVLSRS